MVEKIKRLISSEQIPTVNSGLQLLDSLQDQSLYEKLLQGWCIKNGRLSHPEKPFSAFVAWHLWMHAPNEISTLQITDTLGFSLPHIAHLPLKGWQRLAKLKNLKLPPESVFRTQIKTY